MNNWLCLLGFHDWIYSGPACTLDWVRKCSLCEKSQKASYDMTYGETVWQEYRE